MGARMLGIVGGIGPESTLDYYRRLIDAYHARRDPQTHPPVLINSLDGGPLIAGLLAGDLEPARRSVATAVAQLAAGGAGIALIASVAAHSVFETVAPAASIPMLSIIRATCRAALVAGIRRPAIFAPRITTEGLFFARPFEAAGIALVRPAGPERAWINDIYLRELLRGVIREATRTRLLEILAQLRGSSGADGLILGGTELSLILPEPTYDGLPVLNAAAIHVAESVDWLLGADPPGPDG
jgi:aspartate racemase